MGIFRNFLGFAACLAIATPAIAADDLPYGGPVVKSDMYSWTGFFVGASVGESSGDLSSQFAPHLTAANNFDLSDTVFGGQAGYRYEFENDIVIGAWASIPFASLNGSADQAVGTNTYSAEVESAYLVNFMAGVGVGRWLPYAAYGVGQASVKSTSIVAGAAQTADAEHELTAVTFGLKYAIWENLSIGGAWQKVRASQEDYNVPLNAGLANGFGFETDGFHFMIDYKF